MSSDTLLLLTGPSTSDSGGTKCSLGLCRLAIHVHMIQWHYSIPRVDLIRSKRQLRVDTPFRTYTLPQPQFTSPCIYWGGDWIKVLNNYRIKPQYICSEHNVYTRTYVTTSAHWLQPRKVVCDPRLRGHQPETGWHSNKAMWGWCGSLMYKLTWAPVWHVWYLIYTFLIHFHVLM